MGLGGIREAISIIVTIIINNCWSIANAYDHNDGNAKCDDDDDDHDHDHEDDDNNDDDNDDKVDGSDHNNHTGISYAETS